MVEEPVKVYQLTGADVAELGGRGADVSNDVAGQNEVAVEVVGTADVASDVAEILRRQMMWQFFF